MKEQKFVEVKCIGEGWQLEYERKRVSAQQAVQIVRSGDRVIAVWFNGTTLCEALAARANELENVTIHSSLPTENSLGLFLEEDIEHAFRNTVEIYIGDYARIAPTGSDSKKLQFLPGTFSSMFKPFDERPEECPYTIDVVIVMVSTPDKDGFCSFGSNLWTKRSYCKRARLVIAQTNERLIRTGGSNFIHVSEIDYFVDGPAIENLEFSTDEREELIQELLSEAKPEVRALIEAVLPHIEREMLRQRVVENLAGLEVEEVETRLNALKQRLGIGIDAESGVVEETDPVAEAIAGYVSQMVKDGDTFQIGTGYPSQLMVRLGAFDDKKDLGIYSEMAAPGFAELVQRGIVTGKYKTFHPGKVTVTSFLGCGPGELDIVNGNPVFEAYDSEYVLDVRNISQNDNFVAINNAIAVDLTGQINVETGVGSRMINGHGGLPEMHLGGILSKGGRSLTLLPSTALEGSVSRIVPQLDQGAVVTIPRYYADYIITEYGIARLMGKNCRQRAEALIDIAHPDFREELGKAARELFYP